MKLQLMIANSDDLIHGKAFQLVQEQYWQFFEARLTEPAPSYAVAHLGEAPVATVAIRHLDDFGSTLSEIYLGQPLEQWIDRHLGISVERSRLVEAGSLACTDPRYVDSILCYGTTYAYLAGQTHIVVTATRSLRHLIRRLNFPVMEICDARPDLLDVNSRMKWGSYYSDKHRPKVLLLDTEEMFLNCRRLFRDQLKSLQQLKMVIPHA